MYKYIYYQYFCFSKFVKDNVPGSNFHNSSFDAVLLLSIMEFLNIVTFGIWAKTPIITLSQNLDLLLLGIILLGFNSFYFLSGKRYRKLNEQCDVNELNKKSISGIFTIVYSILSLYLFYLVHSSK